MAKPLSLALRGSPHIKRNVASCVAQFSYDKKAQHKQSWLSVSGAQCGNVEGVDGESGGRQ